ncbi:MAG: hypothetical protein ACE5EF_06765 [Dehalococcoidia bacterium]
MAMMSSLRPAFLMVLVAFAAATIQGHPFTSHAAGTVTVVVTNAGDSPGVCPSPARCTLRAAIDFVNADATPETPYLIRFSASVFSAGGTTIPLMGDALPAIGVPDVTIDPAGLPIRLSGAALESGDTEGLVLAAARGTVRGLEISRFPRSCVVLAGDSNLAGGITTDEGIRVGGCATGIRITGDHSQVIGSEVGFTADGVPNPVGTGVEVAASNVTLGPATGAGAPGANFVGNAAVGVRIAGGGQAIEAILVRTNRIGLGRKGESAPVGSGIVVDHIVAGALVQANIIANSASAAIGIAADAESRSIRGVALSGNSFRGIGGLPIDLGIDGQTQDNDTDDSDSGPNGLQNHPVIRRAVTDRVSGVVPGCSQCTVEVYTARHRAGATFDRDFEPVAGMIGQTDGQGTFSLTGATLDAGSWVAALATGREGTSEFGSSARTGTGSITCTPGFLTAGWNHTAYLGQPVSLGAEFPSGGDTGAVSAIYELVDGEGTFLRWFPGSGPGRTLTELVPGSAYWIYAERPVDLGGGFSFSSPIPLSLEDGWNDFVYLGATGDVRDVFRSLAGRHEGPFFFQAGDPGSWLWGGVDEAPRWAVDFPDLIACNAYYVHFEGAGALIPLQP